MNLYLIIILVLILVIIFLYNKYEKFEDEESSDNNIFYLNKLPNIFYTKQFYDNLFIPPKPNISTLPNITINSYLNSDIVMNKIECASIVNQAKCWDNNNCQWVEKIGSKSFCTLAPKLLL
jgi:hypothetical protein